MRKAICLIFVFVMSLAAAHAQKAVWNLSRDVRANNNEISFNQGSNGVWYFMESASLKHVPPIYRFLPNYAAPCVSGPNTPLVNGIACWEDPAHTIDLNPKVGVNFTNQTLFLISTVGIPPHAVFVHPAPDRFAIVAWKSPLNAIVSITGAFTDLDPNCGNGILWFVEKGSQRLAFGNLPNGGSQSFSLPNVIVSPGQVLYFIVDPKNGDYGCDTTMVDLTIDEVIYATPGGGSMGFSGSPQRQVSKTGVYSQNASELTRCKKITVCGSFGLLLNATDLAPVHTLELAGSGS